MDLSRRRLLIEDLEFDRVKIPHKNWKLGPEQVNAIIAALEAKYRGDATPREPEGVANERQDAISPLQVFDRLSTEDGVTK